MHPRWNFWALDETLRQQLDLSDPGWQRLVGLTGEAILVRIAPNFARAVGLGYQGYFEVEIGAEEDVNAHDARDPHGRGTSGQGG